jgi:hypothetical protein
VKRVAIQFNAESLIGIVGHRGCGKSYLCRYLIKALAPQRLFVVDPFGEFTQFGCKTALGLPELIALVKADCYRVRIESSDPEPALAACEIVYELGNACLVLDEADAILGPCRYETPDAFRRICSYGRHVKSSAICLAHRAIDLPRIFTCQATVLFSHAVDPRERAWLAARIGKEPPSLPQYHFGIAPLYGEYGVIKAS